MTFVKSFISEYGVAIAYTIVTALVSYLAMAIKKLAKKWINTKTKRVIAREVVGFVEQVYKNIHHGEEKFQKAVEAAAKWFELEGIVVAELELKFLIESALSELNKAFKKDDKDKEKSEEE